MASNDSELTVYARRASCSDSPPTLRTNASRIWSRKLCNASRSVAVENESSDTPDTLSTWPNHARLATAGGRMAPMDSRSAEGPALGGDPTDATLAAYRAAAQLYLEHSARPAPSVLAYLDRIGLLLRGGDVLELGSGPGWDADHLEKQGVRVTRSDAAPEFVDRLREAGHDALLLDLRKDDLGGPYDGILADAVLLHLSREQFEAVLRRCRTAVRPGGILGVTLKEGHGSGWTEEKIGLPRYFTYWQEDPLRVVLARTGWEVLALKKVPGRTASWLQVIARR